MFNLTKFLLLTTLDCTANTEELLRKKDYTADCGRIANRGVRTHCGLRNADSDGHRPRGLLPTRLALVPCTSACASPTCGWPMVLPLATTQNRLPIETGNFKTHASIENRVAGTCFDPVRDTTDECGPVRTTATKITWLILSPQSQSVRNPQYSPDSGLQFLPSQSAIRPQSAV